MALVNFDVNGAFGTTPNGGRDAALAGVWAELDVVGDGGAVGVDATGFPSSAQKAGAIPRLQTSVVRTGASAWYFPAQSSGPDNTVAASARMQFGTAKSAIGMAFAWYMPALFTLPNNTGWSLRDIDNNKILTFTVETDGAVRVRAGGAGGTLLGVTTEQIPAGGWHHIEVFAERHATAGTCEVRFNGVTVLELSGLALGAANWSQVGFGSQQYARSLATQAFYLDDLIVWDSTGADFNDFLGPIGCHWLPVDADTAQADWSVNGAASGHAALSPTPPDGDTSYIESTTSGDISEFGVSDLPAGITIISGVAAVGMMRSPDAGQTRMSVISGVDVADGALRTQSTIYNYGDDAVYDDPATGAPWTRDGVNALKLRLTSG